MYDRPLDANEKWLEKKFAGKDTIIEANKRAMNAGYNYADTTELFTTRFKVEKAILPKGSYRSINGNYATALGLLAASEKSKLKLFYGGYPITPASDILHTLAAWKHFGVQNGAKNLQTKITRENQARKHDRALFFPTFCTQGRL